MNDRFEFGPGTSELQFVAALGAEAKNVAFIEELQDLGYDVVTDANYSLPKSFYTIVVHCKTEDVPEVRNIAMKYQIPSKNPPMPTTPRAQIPYHLFATPKPRQLRLGDIALVFKGKQDTVLEYDDIVLRRVSGSANLVMEPSFGTFLQAPENSIIVRVQRKDLIDPKYLFYVFQWMWSTDQARLLDPSEHGSVQRFVTTQAIKRILIESRD